MTEPKLKDLVDDLHDAASKWRAIGVQLELPMSTLKAIDYQNRGNCNQALQDMLSEWVQQLNNVTWAAVVEALKSKSVGEVALARDIEQRRRGRASAATKRADNENLANDVQSLTTRQTATGNVPGNVRQDGCAAASVAELTSDDMIEVSTYLSPLSKEEIKTLGRLLGLREATITDQYDGPKCKYLDSILTAWFKKQDKVMEKGGPKWHVLVEALQHELLRQNGIAKNIQSDRLSA